MATIVENYKKAIRRLDQAVDETKSRIKEAEQFLLEPELEYRQRCGNLDPDRSWR